MAKKNVPATGTHASPFERIKRTNNAGMEFWSSREFAGVLGYGDYRNFEGVIEKAKIACFNSGHRIQDHFVDITEMVTIGSGTRKELLMDANGRKSINSKTIISVYSCALAAHHQLANR
jgi:hypothetical protein